jgi:hypothetical protein
MKMHALRHILVRQLNLLPLSLPLNSLRFIGRIFLSSIIALWLLWMVDTLQQRDVLHLLTGGSRVLKEVPAISAGEREKQQIPQTPPQTAPKTSNDTEAYANSLPSWLLYGLMSVFRVPILILLGIITPLALFIWNWESVAYSEILNPYLMLLGAQAGSLIVGILLLGEGIVPFIGLLYSGLRVFQISGLLDCRYLASSHIPKPLRLVLRAALVLWSFNAIALALHIVSVTFRLLHPG